MNEIEYCMYVIKKMKLLSDKIQFLVPNHEVYEKIKLKIYNYV